MKLKTCGRDNSCDLVLEDATLSPLHAYIELGDDGRVSIRDNDSGKGVFLNRNDSWIRFRKVTLCIGDRIRFGVLEVPLEQLTAVFGQAATTRLEARHFPLRNNHYNKQSFANQRDHGPLVKKPRRNPSTGKIEEERPG